MLINTNKLRYCILSQKLNITLKFIPLKIDKRPANTIPPLIIIFDDLLVCY